MNEGDIHDTEKAARAMLPPDTLQRRWRDADKLHLLQHAENLEAHMRVLAALLESRDHSNPNGGTPTSVRVIAEAKRLARLEP